MTLLDDILATDESNTASSLRALSAFDLRAQWVIESVAQLHRTYLRAFHYEIRESESTATLDPVIALLGTDNKAAIQAFLDGSPPDDETAQRAHGIAKELLAAAQARRVRAILMLLSLRAYLWAVADLMRLKATAALGQLRVQIEATALISVFRQQPIEAERWLTLLTDEEGRKFFNTHKKAILEFVRTCDLGGMWERASGAAHHARFGTIVSSLGPEFFEKFERGTSSVGFQEVREDESIFFLNVLHLLSGQTRIFKAYRAALPEVTDPLVVDGHVGRVTAEVQALWGTFNTRYPKYAQAKKQADSGGV